MKTLKDTLIIFREEAAATLKNRWGIIIGLLQPLLYLVLFGPLLMRVIPGGGESAWMVFVPGLLVQLSLFATGYAGFTLIPDIRAGVIERMRVTPVSRFALLMGRIMRDVLTLLMQAAAILVLGFLFGLRASPGGVLAGLAVLVVVGTSLAALSYVLAAALPMEYLFAPVLSGITLPLLLLSGILLPLSFAPSWLQIVSLVNPYRYAVDAMRGLFAGTFGSTTVLVGLAVTVAFAAVTLVAGTRVFARLNS